MVRDHEIEGLDDVGRHAAPLRVQHLEADDVGAGRHTRTVGQPPLARRGDNARDVRAVSVSVEPQTTVIREVEARDDPAAEFGNRGDARVDHRDPDALARERPDPGRPPTFMNQVRPDGLVGHVHLGRNHVIARKLVGAWIVRQPRQRARGHIDDRSRCQALRDAQPVTRCEAIYLRFGARDDDTCLPLVPDPYSIRQIPGQARAPSLCRRVVDKHKEDAGGHAQR